MCFGNNDSSFISHTRWLTFFFLFVQKIIEEQTLKTRPNASTQLQDPMPRPNFLCSSAQPKTTRHGSTKTYIKQ